MTARLTAEDKQFILRRHQEGAPFRQIGRELDRPAITVRRTLESLGIAFGPPQVSHRPVSRETEALVLRLYDEGRTWAEINERAGITSRTLARIIERNGREHDRKRRIDDRGAELITTLYEAGHSTREISRLTGRGKSTVNAVVARSGGEIRHQSGCENPDYFDSIDTPEKAYWLGFIAADGCIVSTPAHPEGNHLAVQLAVRDREHLVKLKAAIGATSAILSDAESVTLFAYSRRLADALVALGVTPRKSATLEPWSGPADLMPHYWRGMVDGDGSLAIKGSGLYTVFLCGSEATVRAFAAWAHGICGTTAEPYFRTGCWYLAVSGRYQVPPLVRALYETGTVSLDRKHERADVILSSGQPRRKPGPPRMEFPSEEARTKHIRAQKAAQQRRYMERKRQAAAAET